ncbi:MAG: GNAT family N-acetyltransferase [Casimicrobium sp.]
MNRTELLAQYDEKMRHRTHVAGYTREKIEPVARYTTQRGSLRYILWYRFAEADIADIVEREVSAVRGKADGLMWKVYAHDTPSTTLATHLISRGFMETDPSTLMVAPVATILNNAQVAQDRVVIRQLTTPESLDAYLDIWNEVWPDGENARYVDDYRLLAKQNDPHVLFFAAFADEHAVSTGYMFHEVGSPFALLCGGTTKTQWRGKRIYTSLVAERARHARERGVEFLSVEASPESLPILRSLGFEPLSTLAFYELNITPS